MCLFDFVKKIRKYWLCDPLVNASPPLIYGAIDINPSVYTLLNITPLLYTCFCVCVFVYVCSTYKLTLAK